MADEKKEQQVKKEPEKTEKKATPKKPSETEILKSENAELKKQLEETKNDYLRARADCENVRKRKAEDVRSAYDDGKLDVISKVLNIGDSLDWALKMQLDDKTREGIELLLKKYHETLDSMGVKEFSPEEGEPFDPNTASAVMQVEKESEKDESGHIKAVFGRGYKLGEKVIRYAQVSVIK